MLPSKRAKEPMTREHQTGVIVFAMALLFGAWLYLYIQSEERAAIATGDTSRCWSSECRIDVATRSLR